MSLITANRSVTPSFVLKTSSTDAVSSDPPAASVASGRRDATDKTVIADGSPPSRGQLRQLKFEQASIRHKREVSPAEAESTATVYPQSQVAAKADTQLQKTLTHLLLTGRLRGEPFPSNSSVRPFIDAFCEAAREPQVQAWFRSKGLDQSTVRVFSDGVEGTVLVDGVKVTRRFTTTDGSGWWEVGAKVSEAAKKLRPDDFGVLLPGEHTVPFRDLNAVLHFYGVKMSVDPTEGKTLGEQLKKAGWPVIANEKRTEWRQQFEQLSQKNSDVDVRSHLASQLKALVKDKSQSDSLTLSNQRAVVHPDSTLAQKSLVPRERLVQWLATPAFKTFIEKAGLGGADNVYRIDNGNLELRNSANQWICLQVFLDDEIGKVSVGGSSAEKTAIRALNNDFHQLIAMSKATGNVLYSRPLYDVRQLLAFSGLEHPETVAHVNSAIAWLTTKLPSSPIVGDYAGLSPYLWTPGALSPADFNVLKSASTEPGSVMQLLATHVTRDDLPNDEDLQLLLFFDSPQAVDKARELARRLNMAEVAGGEPLSRATRHQLMASAIKAGVNAEMPGKPGVIAGYELYQPKNLGRSLDDVRGDLETQLRAKGADAQTAPLIAHVLLAQAAPEFLLKPDRSLSADAPAALKLAPGLVGIGSTAWINLRLGCAMAEKLGGAGSSRALNIAQAQALTRLAPMGPEHETLLKCLGTQPLLDWALINGVFPRTSNELYSAGDYKAAAQAFAAREAKTVEAFQSLTSEPPTQASLLVDQLALLFPEMTKEQIAGFRLELDTDKPYNRRNEAHLETRTPLLTELILTEQARPDPFFAFQKWLNDAVFGVKKYTFTHPGISRETFNARIKKLPIIETLVAPAVNRYLADYRNAQETVIKLMIANAPLDVRQGLASADVEIFTLREETGEPLAQDQAQDSKVSEKTARQGVLLRYKNQGPDAGYTYLEMFPGSMKVSKRHLLFSELKLDGVVEKGTVPYGPFANISADFRKATPVDFDLQAYQTGSEPRPGLRSKAIIEKFGETLPGQNASSGSNTTRGAVPDSWAAKKTGDIAKAIVNATFNVKPEALMAYANAPSTLQQRRSYPFDSGKVFTRENLRTVLSLIPFVGAVADIADGNIGAGLKGLLIDFASFAATGGVSAAKNFFRGIKTLVPFSGSAFTMTAARDSAPFFRSLFNPLDGVFDVFRIGPKAASATKQVMRGELVALGPGFFLATTAFEKCRWGVGAYEALLPQQASSAYPGSQVGVSQNCPLHAVQIDAKWYAIDPTTQKPFGAPLVDFTPDSQ